MENNNEELLPKQNEDEQYTELKLEKSSDEETIQENDGHVDMVGEMDDVAPESKNEEEDTEIEDEPPIDLSTIELDDDGIPVLTNQDIKQLTIFQMMNISQQQLLMNVQMTRSTLLKYAENAKLPDDDPDKIKLIQEDIDAIENGKQFLARLQVMARDKEEILRNGRLQDASEQGIIFSIFITAMYRNFIENPKQRDFFPSPELSISDYLKENNYSTYFTQRVGYRIQHSNENNDILNKFISKPEAFTRLGLQYDTTFVRIFYYLANFFKFSAAGQSEKTINSLTSSIVDKLYDCVSIATVNDKDVQNRFLDIAFYSLNKNEDERDQKIASIKEQLDKNLFYNEFMEFANKDELIQSIVDLINKLYDIVDKLCSDFDTKQEFIDYLIKLVEYCNKEQEKILKKYKKADYHEFATWIIDTIKSTDIPDKKKKDEDEEDKRISVTEETLEEIEEELLHEEAQIHKDKFTPSHYPILEMMKIYRAMEEHASYYIKDSTNPKQAYPLIISLLHFYIVSNIYSTLQEDYYSVMYSKDITNLSIDYDKSIKDMYEDESVKEIAKNYSGNHMSGKFKEILVGHLLNDISTCMAFTEFSGNSDEYIDNAYKYYNTDDNMLPELELMPVTKMYRRNNVTSLRYYNFKEIVKVLSSSLDKFDTLFDKSAYEKIKEHENNIESNRVKRKPRSKRKKK